MRCCVTGGAGFIGCHSCAEFARDGFQVVCFDNMSRRGSAANAHWLEEQGYAVCVQGDVRKPEDLARLWANHGPFDVVIHLAGQVAVTQSVLAPREDFEANALGALNVLEACRSQQPSPIVLYSSTNKVYGGMEEVAVIENPTRWMYRDLPEGISERQPLDFHSPYGCSKGCGDQYVRDYARIYGMPTVVFRQSCIYGPRQFGIEDQGWLAWFAIAALFERPIAIYGDGKQVRDVLHVDDLVRLYRIAVERIETARGQVYNVGGGPDSTLSIWAEFGPMLEEALGRSIPVTYNMWRPGDQPVYVSSIKKAHQELGWEPRIGVREGLGSLVAWVQEHRELVAQELGFALD